MELPQLCIDIYKIYQAIVAIFRMTLVCMLYKSLYKYFPPCDVGVSITSEHSTGEHTHCCVGK